MKCDKCVDLRSAVSDAISRHSLIDSAKGPIIVGLSGGGDSVALADVLCSMGVAIVAVHCNFHLRGLESMRDEAVARRVAARLGIECRVVHFDVEARRRATGESIEMACRELRYDYFDKLRRETGAQAIAVAHHGDDNVETLMLNFMRGCGIAGAKGMLPRNGFIIRPMLGVCRADVTRYLEERGLEWITDSSNLSNEFRRNRLRNEALPALDAAFPGSKNGIMRSMANLADDYRFFTEMVEELKTTYCHDGTIDLARLIAERPTQAQLLLGQWLAPAGFDRKIAADIIRSANESGRRFTSGDTTLLLDRGTLRPVTDIHLEADSAPQLVCPGHPPLEMTTDIVDNFAPKPGMAYFDARILDGDPTFELRHWRIGDRFKPFGMKGSKKLSDLFNDLKIAGDAKNRVTLLTRNGVIVWVIGLRQSRDFCVTTSTRRFIALRYNP